MKFRILLFAIALTAVAAAAAIAFKGSLFPRNLALAEYSVSNLTCGSCVENIRKALSQSDGVGEVEVSVTTGRSRVLFDPEDIEPERIAEMMNSAGYPSELEFVLSPEEYMGMQEEESRLAERFVARVSGRLIPREEFQAELDHLRRSSPDEGKKGLARAAWERLVQREVLLAEAERRGIVVSDLEVSGEIDGMKAKMKNFEAFILKRYDSLEAFHKRVKTNLILDRLFEDAIPASDTEPAVRSLALQKWYSELLDLCTVTILDPQLKIAVENAGGCGGSCCG